VTHGPARYQASVPQRVFGPQSHPGTAATHREPRLPGGKRGYAAGTASSGAGAIAVATAFRRPAAR
jgi:hypothetical protein